MARLNIERQNRLEPKRLTTAVKEITRLGYDVNIISKSMISFKRLGHEIRYFPYSRWATGTGIKDGRGLQNLLDQL